MKTHFECPSLPKVHRLGLATRGNTSLEAQDIDHAIDRGLNYLNWCGHPDGMSRAVSKLGNLRSKVAVATQLSAVSGEAMKREFDSALETLGTDYLDVATFYYLETCEEWEAIRGPAGALDYLREQKEAGRVRGIGITSHQRKLAAQIASGGEVDLLMIRYNAAHRGAEEDIFPVTDRAGIPVVAYTGLRWGALIQPPRSGVYGGTIPSAPDCYRFVLSNPSVAVALMAPDGRKELEQNLSLLDSWTPLSTSEMERFREWGDLIHRSAGGFP